MEVFIMMLFTWGIAVLGDCWDKGAFGMRSALPSTTSFSFNELCPI